MIQNRRKWRLHINFIFFATIYCMATVSGCSPGGCSSEKAIGEAKFGMTKDQVEDAVHQKLVKPEKPDLACPGVSLMALNDKEYNDHSEEYKISSELVYGAFPKILFLFHKGALTCVDMEFDENPEKSQEIVNKIIEDTRLSYTLKSTEPYKNGVEGKITVLENNKSVITIYHSKKNDSSNDHLGIEKATKAFKNYFQERHDSLNKNPL